MFKIDKKYIELLLKWKFYIGIGLLAMVIIILSLISNSEDDSKNENLNTINNSKQNISKSNDVHKKDSYKPERHSEKDNSNGKIFIDIKGAVERPNVYQMSTNERVIDAINKAKPLKDADLTQINLSERLVDQKLIYIPKKGEQSQNNKTNDKSSSNLSNTINQNEINRQINLNNATESDLKSVPGIGPSKAKEIINYREQNGGFKKVDDLKNIKGFGDKTFERLKGQFIV